MDSFFAKLRLVRKEYPAANGTIVSAMSFTDAVAAHAASEGIQLTLYRDLQASLFDGECYSRALRREFEQDDRYNLGSYIEPFILSGSDTENEWAHEIANDEPADYQDDPNL